MNEEDYVEQERRIQAYLTYDKITLKTNLRTTNIRGYILNKQTTETSTGKILAVHIQDHEGNEVVLLIIGKSFWKYNSMLNETNEIVVSDGKIQTDEPTEANASAPFFDKRKKASPTSEESLLAVALDFLFHINDNERELLWNKK